MRVLVACEYSATVRDAFRARGFDAWSCDLLPTEGDPRWHIQGDALDVIDRQQWDLLIAHPPCTYMTNSGVCHLHTDLTRWSKLDVAAAFFRALWAAPVKAVAIENPVMHKYAKERIGGMRQAQTIQPYQFGHMEQKATCLWLRGLPKLKPTSDLKDATRALPDNERQRLHYLPPSADRWKLRSTTFQGIADAMADQWGEYLLNNRTAPPSRACAAGEAFDPRVSPNPLQNVSHDAPYTGDRA
jgi:hypothetical protein